MARQIRRALIQYEHVFVQTGNEGGKLVILDQKKVILPERMGSKKIVLYKKDHPELDGFTLVQVNEVKTTYAMDLDVFIKNAVIVND